MTDPAEFRLPDLSVPPRRSKKIAIGAAYVAAAMIAALVFGAVLLITIVILVLVAVIKPD